MKKKILILIDQPITKYFVKRIELKYLLNIRKVDVYIFNLLFFFNKKIYSYYDANNLKFKSITKIVSYYDFFKNIRKIKGEKYCLNLIGNVNLKSLFINIYLKFNNFTNLRILHLGDPSYRLIKKRENFLKRIFKSRTVSIPQYIFKTSLRFLNKFISENKKKDIVIFTSPILLKGLDKNKNYYKANSFETTQSLNNLYKIKKKKYFVFVDQEQEDNYDHKINYSLKNYINPNDYLSKLNLFFDNFENKYNYKIKIALANRRVKNINKLKKKRLAYRNKTVELIRDSAGIITHNSLAINYAIFFKKPIIFLHNNDMKKKNTKFLSINGISNLLGSINFNLDDCFNSKFDNINLKTINKINYYKYKKYEYTYLKFKHSDKLKSFVRTAINQLI